MTANSVKKHLGFGLGIIAIGLFLPGIILPMFALSMDMIVAMTGAGFNTDLISRELSILTTVRELFEQNRILVALLIFVVSVVIPLVKTSLVSFVYFTQNAKLQNKLANFVTTIGKWSMADVFVVAVFLAVLSTNHTDTAQEHELTFFGMQIGFQISTQTLSNVGQGFYFFVAYCVLSLLGSQLLLSAIKNEHAIDNSETNSAENGADTSANHSTT